MLPSKVVKLVRYVVEARLNEQLRNATMMDVLKGTQTLTEAAFMAAIRISRDPIVFEEPPPDSFVGFVSD